MFENVRKIREVLKINDWIQDTQASSGLALSLIWVCILIYFDYVRDSGLFDRRLLLSNKIRALLRRGMLSPIGKRFACNKHLIK